MDKLVQVEKSFYDSLKNYVKMEKERIDKISDLYQQISKGVNGTNLPHRDHAKHPLAIYLLIKRFLITWKEIEITMAKEYGQGWFDKSVSALFVVISKIFFYSS